MTVNVTTQELNVYVSQEDNDTKEFTFEKKGTTIEFTLGGITKKVNLSDLVPATQADRFLSNVTYDKNTKELVFTTSKDGEEDTTFRIPVEDIFKLEIEEVFNTAKDKIDIQVNLFHTDIEQAPNITAVGKIKGTNWYVFQYDNAQLDSFVETARELNKKRPFELSDLEIDQDNLVFANGSDGFYGAVAKNQEILLNNKVNILNSTLPRAIQLYVTTSEGYENNLATYYLDYENSKYILGNSYVNKINANYSIKLEAGEHTLTLNKTVTTSTDTVDYEKYGISLVNVTNEYTIGSQVTVNVTFNTDDSLANHHLASTRMVEYQVPLRSVDIEFVKQGLALTVPDDYLLDNCYYSFYYKQQLIKYSLRQLQNLKSFTVSTRPYAWSESDTPFNIDSSRSVTFSFNDGKNERSTVLYNNNGTVRTKVTYADKPEITDLDEVLRHYPMTRVTPSLNEKVASVFRNTTFNPKLRLEDGKVVGDIFGDGKVVDTVDFHPDSKYAVVQLPDQYGLIEHLMEDEPLPLNKFTVADSVSNIKLELEERDTPLNYRLDDNMPYKSFGTPFNSLDYSNSTSLNSRELKLTISENTNKVFTKEFYL